MKPPQARDLDWIRTDRPISNILLVSKGIQTETAPLECTATDIAEALDEALITLLMLLYLSTPSDVIDHPDITNRSA